MVICVYSYVQANRSNLHSLVQHQPLLGMETGCFCGLLLMFWGSPTHRLAQSDDTTNCLIPCLLLISHYSLLFCKTDSLTAPLSPCAHPLHSSKPLHLIGYSQSVCYISARKHCLSCRPACGAGSLCVREKGESQKQSHSSSRLPSAHRHSAHCIRSIRSSQQVGCVELHILL